MGKGGGLLPIIGERPKPKSLIEAISDIQMYANMERDGQPLPESYLLLRERMSFMEVGLKGGLVSTLISGLTLPISVAVIEQLFPIFGTTHPSAFDQMFALLLSVSFALGYNIVTAMNLSACFIGPWSKKAIYALYGALFTGKALVVVGLFWFYHYLYFFLTPNRLGLFVEKTQFIQKLLLLTPGTVGHLTAWILQIRHAFLIAAWLVLVLTTLTAVVSIVIFLLGQHRIQRDLAKKRLYLDQ
ncbi:MAG: hypothetical protein AB1411_02670 [Nitrospirota bacterium]